MHIHVLGICGTFMGSLALLAQQLGYRVTGCDQNVYPPMSDLLAENGIDVIPGFSADQISLKPDCFIIGNAMARGNPLVEAILNRRLPYMSGPGWLSQCVLLSRWVLAVAGTHGKTTTTSLLLHLLKAGGLAPGFLVGGVPLEERRSSELGESDFFVIEADEYDTAFFDKRSKFVHYHPNTLIMNNLEFDHADIFPDIAAIQRQFHHLVRVVPSEGLIICPDQTPTLDGVLEHGCWTPVSRFSLAKPDQQELSGWHAKMLSEDGSEFAIYEGAHCHGRVQWSMLGEHNVSNAMAAVLAARHVGVAPGLSLEALASFSGVKRRLEPIGSVEDIQVYDDFAHHPTAIKTTLAGLSARVNKQAQAGRVLAIIELRSNTMRMGHHKARFSTAVLQADQVWWFEPQGLSWDLSAALGEEKSADHPTNYVMKQTQTIIDDVVAKARPNDHIVIMSNGGFEGLHARLVEALRQKHAAGE